MRSNSQLIAEASPGQLLDAEVVVSWLTPPNPADLALVWVRRPYQTCSSLILLDVSRLRGPCKAEAG